MVNLRRISLLVVLTFSLTLPAMSPVTQGTIIGLSAAGAGLGGTVAFLVSLVPASCILAKDSPANISLAGGLVIIATTSGAILGAGFFGLYAYTMSTAIKYVWDSICFNHNFFHDNTVCLERNR